MKLLLFLSMLAIQVSAQNPVYKDTIRMVWPVEWISLNDSLPPSNRQVLTYVKLCYRFMKDLPRECHYFQYVTWYDGLNPPYEFNLHEIRDHDYGTEQAVEVTHWMPLPPKPKDR